MSIRGAGIGMVSCLLKRDGLSFEVIGGYVECQSASVTGTRGGTGGGTCEERGDETRGEPDLEDGLGDGGYSYCACRCWGLGDRGGEGR